MILDNILMSEADPADRIRQLAMRDRLDMTARGARLVEEKYAISQKVSKAKASYQLIIMYFLRLLMLKYLPARTARY